MVNHSSTSSTNSNNDRMVVTDVAGGGGGASTEATTTTEGMTTTTTANTTIRTSTRIRNPKRRNMEIAVSSSTPPTTTSNTNSNTATVKDTSSTTRSIPPASQMLDDRISSAKELLHQLREQAPPQTSSPKSSSVSVTSASNTATIVSTTSNMVLHHQVSALHFGYTQPQRPYIDGSTGSRKNSPTTTWCGMGTTILYMTTTTATAATTTPNSHNSRNAQYLTLHLRNCCTVQSVEVESCDDDDGGGGGDTVTTEDESAVGSLLHSIPNISYGHVDPIQHVLVRPLTPNTTDIASHQQHHTAAAADSQSSRGAAGMTTALRAASITSNQLGELQIFIPPSSSSSSSSSMTNNTNKSNRSESSSTHQQRYEMWKRDIENTSLYRTNAESRSNNDNNNHNSMDDEPEHSPTSVPHRLHFELSQRTSVQERRPARIAAVAQQMAMVSPPNAYKVTIRYHISGLESSSNTIAGGPTAPPINIHLGGLHASSIGSSRSDQDDTDAIHNNSKNNNDITPFLYTVTGVYGDSEGTRCYLPTLDSASVQHRATHNICISITSAVQNGLSIVGCGEDCGISETVLYHHHHHHPPPTLSNATTTTTDSDMTKICDELGFDMLPQIWNKLRHSNETTTTTKEIHVIPPACTATSDTTDDTSTPATTTTLFRPPSVLHLDQIMATTVWCSHIWSPIPCRSIGFAIGPFKVVDDPEYIHQLHTLVRGRPDHARSADDDDDDDDDDDGNEDHPETGKSPRASYTERQKMIVDQAMKNGEGIRQVYLAPKFERKYIYTTRDGLSNLNYNYWHNKYQHRINATLLSNTVLQLQPLTSSQSFTSYQIQSTVTQSTTGVAHRTLSLMRDLLALPSYRTTSYTQIFLPNAVHGGCTSGTFHHCPEVLVNAFLGGAIMDSRLLPPVNVRLPYYHGGRVLQFLQARCAVRGWITAALPLGGLDDVGNGYILTLFESFLMSLYQRGHGGYGEGGGKQGYFYSQRYTANSGLNSTNLDFLPVQNIEEEVVIDGIGAVPVEERHNEQLWRGAINGSESHTSAFDEYCIRQLLYKDGVEALERGTDRDKGVPSPSMGWFGSYLSLTLLSSNATSSIDLGCGAVDMLHPIGGLVYRTLKCEMFRSVVEGRTGIANFIRLLRVAFIAAHLNDIGETEVQLPKRKRRADSVANDPSVPDAGADAPDEITMPTQPFVVCVNEVLKKKGLTHTLFTRALQTLSGRIKEALLVGSLVDVERHAEDPRTHGPFVAPEGFPNSFVRGASMMFCRVGVQVEATRDASAATQVAVAKGVQMQAYAEPVIPEGGIAYGGPITIRVVENEGSFREYVKDLAADGSRRDWGTTFLHAKPVTTAKAQTAASGTIERSTAAKDSKAQDAMLLSLDNPVVGGAFTETDFHAGGYQSIELIRLTNLTPLLWVRVDPAGQYGGRISVFQPDACLAEQLFHDGDASAQVEAIRALAERPLRVQVIGKVTTVYDVNVSELPVRVIGDCLRGYPALHSSLPHTPTVRAQAALAIAQDSVGTENWVGLNILLQYFRERFYSNRIIMPTKFSRLVFKKSEEEVHQASAVTDEGTSTSQPSYDTSYEYLDTLDDDIRKSALEASEVIELEEDEEYRVRSAVVTAIASIRAKDGLTPTAAIKFLETLLESEDAEMVGNIVYDDENRIIQETYKRARAQKGLDNKESSNLSEPSMSYCSSQLVADTLLALCHVNAMPPVFIDPSTGKSVQSKGEHPMYRLFKIARSWLEWELYRENIRFEIAESTHTGISGNCYDTVAACSIIAISNMVILMQSTTDVSSTNNGNTSTDEIVRPVASAIFYTEIFDSEPIRNDLTRAACAQAMSCICCAADRLEIDNVQPVGLLTSLEFLLDRIIDGRTSHSLKQTLALIMMDSCTGKVCSMQRVGAIAGRNDLVSSLARYYLGPLGACHGGDNGSAAITAVSAMTFPAASAVNDGARRGMRLLSRAGHPSSQFRQEDVVRVAIFATRLWRTINGEPADVPQVDEKNPRQYPLLGVCAYNGILRCSLLALWQWIWPKGCYALLQVQSWSAHESTPHYRNIGAHHVMKISDAEKAAATAEENSLSDLNRYVELERDRQVWRGEMAQKAYDIHKASKGQSSNLSQDLLAISTAAAEKGIGQPLPPIARDAAFKQGGWIASAAQQRRALALDGGTAVTKLRLKKDT